MIPISPCCHPDLLPRTDTSEGIPFDLLYARRVAQKPPKAFKQPAVTLSVPFPRVGVLEPEGKHLWVVHKESNELMQKARCPIEVLQYSALG